MNPKNDIEFIDAMVTEMLKLSLRANLRSLVYLLSMAKVAVLEARRSINSSGQSAEM